MQGGGTYKKGKEDEKSAEEKRGGYNRRVVSTAEVRTGERRWKGGWRKRSFVELDVMALWGMCLQGAKGP